MDVTFQNFTVIVFLQLQDSLRGAQGQGRACWFEPHDVVTARLPMTHTHSGLMGFHEALIHPGNYQGTRRSPSREIAHVTSHPSPWFTCRVFFQEILESPQDSEPLTPVS